MSQFDISVAKCQKGVKCHRFFEKLIFMKNRNLKVISCRSCKYTQYVKRISVYHKYVNQCEQNVKSMSKKINEL